MSELSAEAIASALTTRRLGRPVLFFDRIGSTNDVARARAAAGAAEGLLVVADEQTSGRGRYARAWLAPAGTGLLMSLLLRPPLPIARVQAATMCLGLGAVEGIEQATGLHVWLKWPNDLVFAGRKLAGMLTEMETGAQGLAFVVAGLGLNVNLAETDLPPEIAATAISLAQALGRPVPRLPLLAAIAGATEHWYDRLLAGESPHAAWASRLDTIGRPVTVTLPGRTLRGTATGVSPEGALLVETPSGATEAIWAGDVTSLR